MTIKRTLAATTAVAATTALGLGLAVAPASAKQGTAPLAGVLVDQNQFDSNGKDYDIVTEAVLVPFQPEIVSVLVNFDLHNNIPGTSFDNLELDFFGDWLDPGMVRWWYDIEIPGPPPPFSAWGVVNAMPVSKWNRSQVLTPKCTFSSKSR